MSPSWGFVIAACTALVLLLAFGGIGTAMQLERAAFIRTKRSTAACAVLRVLIVFCAVDALLLTVRPEGLDLDRPGRQDGRTDNLHVRHQLHVRGGPDAGTQSAAGDAVHPLQ
ncbi:hypothetical protein LP420_28010 [Massilia sp. B-10]|nr:hypothetical protein LP420_28010 [Massilia sp. B-10]